MTLKGNLSLHTKTQNPHYQQFINTFFYRRITAHSMADNSG